MASDAAARADGAAAASYEEARAPDRARAAAATAAPPLERAAGAPNPRPRRRLAAAGRHPPDLRRLRRRPAAYDRMLGAVVPDPRLRGPRDALADGPAATRPSGAARVAAAPTPPTSPPRT